MTLPVKDIESEALKLEENERAKLAYTLITSLERDQDVDEKDIKRLWLEEAERRIQEIKEGKAECDDAEKVFADIRAELNEKS